jgi:hypothetical protein
MDPNTDTAQQTQEFDAMEHVVSLLQPLPDGSRQRVILYALHQLGIMELRSPMLVAATSGNENKTDELAAGQTSSSTDVVADVDDKPKFQKTILELKLEKKPKFGTEMAAVIAYYLLRVVPKEQRKEVMCLDDVIKYSKKADFSLPKSYKDILIHAVDAGYFEAVGDGYYRLIKPGYDFVEKGLPRKTKNKK